MNRSRSSPPGLIIRDGMSVIGGASTLLSLFQFETSENIDTILWLTERLNQWNQKGNIDPKASDKIRHELKKTCHDLEQILKLQRQVPILYGVLPEVDRFETVSIREALIEALSMTKNRREVSEVQIDMAHFPTKIYMEGDHSRTTLCIFQLINIVCELIDASDIKSVQATIEQADSMIEMKFLVKGANLLNLAKGKESSQKGVGELLLIMEDLLNSFGAYSLIEGHPNGISISLVFSRWASVERAA